MSRNSSDFSVADLFCPPAAAVPPGEIRPVDPFLATVLRQRLERITLMYNQKQPLYIITAELRHLADVLDHLGKDLTVQ